MVKKGSAGLWKKHSAGGKMNVVQLIGSLRDAAEEHREWPLRRCLDAGNPEALALSLLHRFAANGRDYLLQDEFSGLLDAVLVPLIPKERIFEEGFEYVRRRLGFSVLEPPSAIADSHTIKKVLTPRAMRRALGVFHPANLACSAMLVPPGFPEFLCWPFTALCLCYPVSYYCARPCYLRQASLARKLVLTRSTVELVNEGHPGYACCAGPLALLLPFSLWCPFPRFAWEPGLFSFGNQGPFLLSGSPHFFSANCSDPTHRHKIVVPLQFVGNTLLVDHACSCLETATTAESEEDAHCCRNAYQAELAGTSTLAVLSANDSVLIAIDAVPREEAIAFSESLMSAKRTARPLHPSTVETYSRYLDESWVGISEDMRLASLPFAESRHRDDANETLVQTTQPGGGGGGGGSTTEDESCE